MGRITATKPGISRLVSSRNTRKDRPRLTTSSTSFNDWVSQISATSAVVTAASATSNWRSI